MLDSMMPDAAEFRKHVDTVFHAAHASGAVPLRLVDVTKETAGGGFAYFSVFFHGPADRLLPQGTHTLERDGLASLALFIVPVSGSNHERIVYEASFSYAIKADRDPVTGLSDAR